MTISRLIPLLSCSLIMPLSLSAEGVAPGIPSRSEDLDALPGFQEPPAGYGQVPFWWWTGDDLDEDRLLWQLNQLHEKGISGVQVNYSHTDSLGWPSDDKEPKIFTDEWWQVYSRISEECDQLDMGIALSTYTLDWDNGAKNLFYKLFYSQPELNALELDRIEPVFVKAGESFSMEMPENFIAAKAYSSDGLTIKGLVDTVQSFQNELKWTAPVGDSPGYQIWVYYYKSKEGTLNSMLPEVGEKVVDGFYQEFENQNNGSAKGLNFFFNDELEIGLGKYAWNPDFPEEFEKRKGYDLYEALPVMWGAEVSEVERNLLIDYADVRMGLIEERYFEPIYKWHEERNIIFGCDNHGRGLKPDAYGDYYRATRWYAAPGHDTPGGHANMIKGKVSSSIANLYQRPRVWLEGYHSLGWGATPENLMFATRENYLYGCTLLNLHGLYYSTHGSHWEWAPPCYHFRMPYWAHFEHFLKYFDRLSYLMAQGHHVCDVALYYPVTPYEAEVGGEESTQAAFDTATALMAAGINFDFVDHQSIDRAEVVDGRLVIEGAKASYRTLIFPKMSAARASNLTKATSFAEAGGQVIAIGAYPTITDVEKVSEQAPPSSLVFTDPAAAVAIVQAEYQQDVRGITRPVRAYHRKVGYRDVYMVMDAQPGDLVEFRAIGQVELWDPWTGETKPLEVTSSTVSSSQVKLPLEKFEAQIVVFNQSLPHENPEVVDATTPPAHQITDDTWQVEFIPTVDNQWGDFRLPVTKYNKMIGLEAREFLWIRTESDDPSELPTDGWVTQQHGHGPQFQVQDGDGNTSLYEFSWRMGNKHDAGHQGFHGSKGKVSPNFLRLGNYHYTGNGGYVLDKESPATPPFTVTAQVVVEEDTEANLLLAEKNKSNANYQAPNTIPVVAPSQITLNGESLDAKEQDLTLTEGVNTLTLVYNKPGETHFALRDLGIDSERSEIPLSMKWYNDPAILKFEPYDHEEQVYEWLKFTSAPGTTAIIIPECYSQSPMTIWYDGEEMEYEGKGLYSVKTPNTTTGTVLIRLEPRNGIHGGALVTEPILIQTNGEGSMDLGDWSQNGILRTYSGGVKYTKSFELSEDATHTTLDLGSVVATAGVTLNGIDLGVRVAPPWTFDLKDHLQEGENTLEVTVYNTLSNHYQTIPTSYKGTPTSGLMGPVILK